MIVADLGSGTPKILGAMAWNAEVADLMSYCETLAGFVGTSLINENTGFTMSPCLLLSKSLEILLDSLLIFRGHAFGVSSSSSDVK